MFPQSLLPIVNKAMKNASLVLCLLATLPISAMAQSSDSTGLPPISGADWAMYNHDVRGWRFNSTERHLSPENANQLVEKWRFPPASSGETVGAIHATPTVVNGHVYFGTATYPTFYKLSPAGEPVWAYHLGSAKTRQAAEAGGANQIDADNGILASALVTDKRVFFGNAGGVFYALDRLTGEELWKVDARAESFPNHHQANAFFASAIAAGGKIIVGGGSYEHPHPLDPSYPCCTGRGFVVAFDPATGDVIWKYDVGEKPEKFPVPVAIVDATGKHLFQHGPSTSSVWSTPSYDAETETVFFGTDVHNSPRRPTKDDPRLYTKYSAAVVAVDAATGAEKWVTQLNEGDIYNLTLSGYDPNTKRYKDSSVGDTPKIFALDVDGNRTKAVGVGCKNGGFYLLRADTGSVIARTPTFTGEPAYPLQPKRNPRMIALPSPVGGIQTGCATDGNSFFTNGIDWLTLNTLSPQAPESGRVVRISMDLKTEPWRHERPRIPTAIGETGDPVGAGIALANGIACFTTTVSEQLVVLDVANGKVLTQKQIGTVWSGPSISRGRILVGTGSVLFLKEQSTGTLYSFGLPGDDEFDRISVERN